MADISKITTPDGNEYILRDGTSSDIVLALNAINTTLTKPNNIASLSDVNITNPSNKDIIRYSSTREQWENAALTGSDIPVSSSSSETIEEAIGGLNEVTSGSLTLDSTYLRTAENNRWVKKGNIVEFWLTATVNTTWTNNNLVASGLPIPLGDGRIIGLDTSNNLPIRINIGMNGKLSNAYSSTAPISNHIIEVHGTYIAGG